MQGEERVNQERFTAIDRYINQLFAPHDEVLEEVVRAAEQAGLPTRHMLTPNQGQLLHLLALLCNAYTVLEIGTLAGYSAIWIARALPSLGGRMITIDRDPHTAEVARGNIARAGLEAIVEVRVGEALDVMAQLEVEGAGPFDMVFIDADKPPYPDYLRMALRLTRPGSLIVADNAVRGGDILNPAVQDDGINGIRAYNTALADNPDLTATILQMVGAKGYDGMAIAVVGRT